MKETYVIQRKKELREFLLKNRQGKGVSICYLVEIIVVCQKKEIYSMWLQRSKAGPQCESYRMGELESTQEVQKGQLSNSKEAAS